jgi:hypothetical protein
MMTRIEKFERIVFLVGLMVVLMDLYVWRPM